MIAGEGKSVKIIGNRCVKAPASPEELIFAPLLKIGEIAAFEEARSRLLKIYAARFERRELYST